MTPSGLASAARAFDSIAGDFDARFIPWKSVEMQRRAVRRALAEAFRPGARLIEIGAGTGEDARHVDAREQPRRRALRVPLDAGELAGKEEAVVVPCGEGRAERRRAVQVRVPVNAPVAQELRLRQAGDRREDALLLRNPEPGLEADEVPHLACPILPA